MSTDKKESKAIDDPDVQAFGDFLESFRSVERVLAADLQKHAGMSHVWFDALIRIASAPERTMTMGALSHETSLSSGGVTRLVDRLEEAGYVTRAQSKADRRVNTATLTSRGGEALESAAIVHRESIRKHLTGKLTEAGLRRFLDTLATIRVV